MPAEPAPIRTGIIGCGDISGAYLRSLARFRDVQVAAVADLDPARARSVAASFGVPHALTVDELLARADLELVVNLTVPGAHAEVGLAAIAAGKHVYTEKPLATNFEDGERLVSAAQSAGLRLGSAPDTFLGAGLQTCRRLIDDGAIGRPIAAMGNLLNHGHEHWHPNPAFYYRDGGGPLFDMGPYYLTALIGLLGPVERVHGAATIGNRERRVSSQPLAGTIIEPETPTHVIATLTFASGVLATLTTSFDVWASDAPRLEIHGSEASLSLPDPNTFGGPVRLRRRDDTAWHDVPVQPGYTGNDRGVGAADLATALRSGRSHRASSELAFHVLDLMSLVLDSAERGAVLGARSTCERPAPLPPDLEPGVLDD